MGSSVLRMHGSHLIYANHAFYSSTYFRYCSSVLGSCGETRLFTLQKLQNRAARIVPDSGCDAPADAPADALIEKLNWPTIVEIIKRETATMVYKSLIGLAPTYLSNIFSNMLYHISRFSLYKARQILLVMPICHWSRPFF